MSGATEYTAAESMSGATEHVGIGAEEHMQVPIVEVAFRDGKWWSMRQEMCTAGMQGTHGIGEKADVLEPGRGDRYVIDFATGVQTNLDNQRKRSIRIIWVRPQDVVPQFTGQLPTTPG